MKELFNKPILDQMYEFRKDDFEQAVYDTNKEIQGIEERIGNLADNFIDYLKQVITDEKEAKKAVEKFEKYQLKSVDSIEFWCKTYFKLGMVEREKIRNEFFENKIKIEKNNTFLNYEANSWIGYNKLDKKVLTIQLCLVLFIFLPFYVRI